MEHLIETIDLDVEDTNELLFKVNVEGNVSGPAHVRLVCESEDVSYMFNGHPSGEDGVVEFTIPKMPIKEGTYNSKIEVLIENRYFVPVNFGINFKKAVKVFVESMNMPIKKAQSGGVKVFVAPISAPKLQKIEETKSEIKPLVIAEDLNKKPVEVSVEQKTTKQSNTLRDRYFKKNVK